MMEETTTLPKTYRIGGPGYGYNTLTTKTVGVNAYVCNANLQDEHGTAKPSLL